LYTNNQPFSDLNVLIKKENLFRSLLHIAFVLMPFALLGQLTTSTALSPAQLVQNILLGSGVTVSNIQFTGSGGAIGEFTATGTNLGINNGVLLTTGTVSNTGEGPHGPNNKPNAGIDNGAPGSPLLSSVLGGAQTFNASILEFDFVPYSDTVRFKYVFASEEYPEFVNQPFNDVFGFFISGPGIIGQQNIAKIPGSNAIISINSVNNGNANTGPCQNCAFYTNNGTGSNAPFNSSTNFIQYDGFTKVLEAVSKVQCGQTYHLRIAVADVADPIYDSGIFLQANSLSSKTPVDITYALSSQAFTDPNVMAEGCVSATVTLTRQGNLSTAMTIPLIVTGTATAGLDYSPIPASVTFAPGQGTINFTFNALADVLTEGLETLKLEFLMSDPCGNQTPLIINLGINDLQPVALVLNDANVLCSGDEITIPSFPSGGVGPYTYNWSTGATTDEITVSPTTTTTYTLTITDNCLFQSATASVTITVPIYPPISLTVTPDITEICPYLNDTLTVSASGGTGVYTYTWSAVGGNIFSNSAIAYIKPSQTTTYQIVVTDQCGIQATDNVLYTITSPPLLLDMSEPLLICPGEDAIISVTATGGWGAYYYSWSPTGQTQATITVNPFNTTTYTVNVSDDCQTFSVSDNVTITVQKPEADFIVSSQTIMEDLPITFQNLTINGASYFWDLGNGTTSTLVHPNATYPEPGLYEILLIATDLNGCIDSTKKGIEIRGETYLYVPNTFTPDGDRYNNVFKASAIGMIDFDIKIFNRWGELIFESKDPDFEWDGTIKKSTKAQDGVYTYVIVYSTRYEINTRTVGHVNLLR
jgi:gliding motility-associated-like protein